MPYPEFDMNVFARLKIGQRLYLGFAVVLALLVGVTALAWTGLQASQAATERVVRMEHRASATEEWMHSTRLNINRVLAVARSRNDPAVDGHFKPLIAKTTERINEVQKALEAEIASERGKALLAEIATKRSEYIAVRKTYFDALKNGDNAGADGILEKGLMPAADAYSDKQQELLDYQRELVAQAVAASGQTVQRQIMTLVGMAALAVALAVLLAWRITRSVTQPLIEAVGVSRDVARGDLTRDVSTTRADELGDLIRALAEMKGSLVNTVGLVRQATDSINTASVEIATGNQDLSARTEQTASNLQQTAASMEQLTSTVRQSADAARQANQLAASAAEIAQRGGSVVSQVVTTMDEINTSSKKINDIIGVIDGIAFQTNILALNAAVEAARAGEQGRGFAVVAGEVRNLAQRSAQAAKEIKGLIGASVEKVETGSKLVADAGQTMSEIVGSVQRVTDIIGEITAAAGEQSDGIGQVNTAVSQLDQMTQQNAALVEESAAAAQSLKDQAGRLAEVVQVFKLDAAMAATSQPASFSVAQAAPAKAPVQTHSAAKPAAARPAPAAATKPAATAAVAPRRIEPVATANRGDEGEWESF
jgi:methyl-accepting chemotaxis protein